MKNLTLQRAAKAGRIIQETIGTDFICYIAQEWKPHLYDDQATRAMTERVQKYALLVLIHYHDNPLNKFVNYDAGDYASIEKLANALDAGGFFVEDKTGWWSAVYVSDLSKVDLP